MAPNKLRRWVARRIRRVLQYVDPHWQDVPYAAGKAAGRREAAAETLKARSDVGRQRLVALGHYQCLRQLVAAQAFTPGVQKAIEQYLRPGAGYQGLRIRDVAISPEPVEVE